VVRDNKGEGLFSDAAPVFEGTGIFHSSGRFPVIRNNELNDFGTGMFVCDKNGIMFQNQSRGAENNFIFCTWPKDLAEFPNGSDLGTAFSATQWLAVGNTSIDALNYGFLVIDGANQNVLVNNNSINAANLDFEFTGDLQDPFLGLLPASFDKVFIAGAF